jgi:hypothetical protein
MVAALASVGPLAPVVVGVARFRTLPIGGKWLLVWLGLSFVLNAAMMTLGLRGIANTPVAHLALPIFCGIGLITFGELSLEPRYRRLVHGLAIFHLLAWGVMTLVSGIPTGFSTYPQSLMNLIVTAAAAGLIVVRLNQLHSRPSRDPTVLIGLGALVSFAPSVGIDPVAAVVSQSEPSLVLALYLCRGVLLIVGITLYTMGLLWIPPRPSLSGF